MESSGVSLFSLFLYNSHWLLVVWQMFPAWMEQHGLLDPENSSLFVTCGDWDLKTMWVFVRCNMYVQSMALIYVCLLEVTCMYREGPLNMLVFVGDDMYMYVQCRASEICVRLLEVTCMCREGPLWVFVRGNLYVQSRAISRCESLLDIQYRSDPT